MYICEICGEIFEDPKIVYETHGLPCPPYEKIAVCPHCKTTNFQEAKQCDGCGEWFADLEGDLCESCYGDIYGE